MGQKTSFASTLDFFCFHFVIDQVLSISGYDLENERMLFKQKYKTKNMAVKIQILILFCFCLLCSLSPVSSVAASCYRPLLMILGSGFELTYFESQKDGRKGH